MSPAAWSGIQTKGPVARKDDFVSEDLAISKSEGNRIIRILLCLKYDLKPEIGFGTPRQMEA